MKKAIYAFSGDPITYGHIDIIERAARVFDEVIVGIGINPSKKYLFTLEQRTNMAKKALKNIRHVKVVSFEGLLVDYAYENEIPVIIKGVRNGGDFDYEIVLHYLSGSQKLDIDTFLLPARQDLSHVSSSGVKALQVEQGLIHDYVPLYVKMCLEARVSGQYIIGITGEIGTGKSYVSERIRRIGEKTNVPVHHIELDHIGHQITGTRSEPSYEKVRKLIAEKFGGNLRLPDGSINRKVLGEIVFKDRKKLAGLNEILYTPLLVRLRRELHSRKGIILFNAALILESDMSYLSNNNVILVTADKKSQKRRLEGRSLDAHQIETRLASQFNEREKRERLLSEIDKSGQGRLWTYENSDSSDESRLELLFDEVISELDIFGELRFQSMWKRLGIDRPFSSEYERVVGEYSSPKREYHTLSHVLSGLDELCEVKNLVSEPLAIECAWWYHDIVYDPMSSTNEEKSALDAGTSLGKAGLNGEFVNKVAGLIRWTRHDEIPEDEDARYIADIDLSILGKDALIFDEYDEKIRKEYGGIEKTAYDEGRARFLGNMLSRTSIYQTDYFKNKYESTARKNIERVLSRLK